MYLVSSLTFGILLLIRASLAQSAPYIYQDSNEDEEALIDRLASLAASTGSQQYSKHQIYPNYDASPLGGYVGDFNDDLAREYLAKLPPQFGYRPDDVRYYMSPEQFPPNLSKDESSKADSETPKYRAPKQNVEQGLERNNLQPQSNLGIEVAPATHTELHHDFEPVSDASYSHFMKKNEMKNTEPAQHAQNIIAGPSHIMSSGFQSVEKPYNNLYPVENDSFSYSDIYYIGLIAGCSAAIVIGIVAAGIFWIHQRVKAAAEVDYPAYGVTGPSKDVSPSGGDRKLASAQMYHYQHQKGQMAALQKGALQEDRPGSAGSDVESEDDNEDDNDYTVYECPGLAPAGEMEVKNPLFQDEATPATPSLNQSEDDK
ncbi:uncharacterized protein LOC110847658 isoform X2 [Folsomia candida]|uniref:uncharacterized protein LOC110847658 isoform X2 n=1 Tax=Folsomia candida TaxID=158441 RepID=UPI000B8F576B|nr:uncharacterized protein LOC110847658 isoform X2 [Folsomia candida]